MIFDRIALAALVVVAGIVVGRQRRLEADLAELTTVASRRIGELDHILAGHVQIHEVTR